MDIRSALNEYKKMYVERLKSLRDDKPDLFEKFEDYLIDEEYEALLSDQQIRNHFDIGSYSYYRSDDPADVYLIVLINNKIGFDETVRILRDTDSYINIDFAKFVVADLKDVVIGGETWDKLFDKMTTSSIISDKVPLHNVTLQNNSGKSSYSEFLRGISAENLLVKGSLSNLVVPSASNVKLDLTDQMLKAGSFLTEDTKVLDLSDYSNLQVLDNALLARVSDKIILPTNPKSEDIRILGVNEDINPNLRIIRKAGIKIKCNKNITEELKKHLDTI